ncbi:hypothetical protein PR202_gb04769 [Eleusine coracana subsp. coracana]|uniref:F-box domain-containing protein n=1 Tax=Eleusine coracana subsp. coracana TaxID=191504 RepID=A0AAV5E672_ELECO|nr:hypothetical protein PR202_gb04769 [Eleusine coracana subsp. coracana]
MRTRSQSRSLANLTMGSSSSSSFDAGSSAGARSEGMMTGAMRRSLANLCAGSGSSSDAGSSAGAGSVAIAMRGGNQNHKSCCAAESGRPMKRDKACLSGAATEVAIESEWRDWADLPSELVEEIAGRLLSADVSEYLRLRSVCKPWRQCTDDPCSCDGGLDPRFRPRDWIKVSHCTSPTCRRLINVCTGARAEVDHPELSTHHCFGVAEGLLVLCDKVTSTVRLLNPLTGTLTSFPTITDVRATCLLPSASLRVFKAFYSSEPRTKEDAPIVMEALKVDVPHPSAINGASFDDSTSPPTLVLGLRYQHFSHWRYYVTTPHGDVMAVDLCPGMVVGPRIVYLYKEMTLSGKTSAYSYLVRSHDQRMLMLFEVDFTGRRLIPQDSIGGNYAAFVGATYTVVFAADKFPKLAADAVYLHYVLQRWRRLGAYHFKNRKISPPRELRPDAHGRIVVTCYGIIVSV